MHVLILPSLDIYFMCWYGQCSTWFRINLILDPEILGIFLRILLKRNDLRQFATKNDRLPLCLSHHKTISSLSAGIKQRFLDWGPHGTWVQRLVAIKWKITHRMIRYQALFFQIKSLQTLGLYGWTRAWKIFLGSAHQSKRRDINIWTIGAQPDG